MTWFNYFMLFHAKERMFFTCCGKEVKEPFLSVWVQVSTKFTNVQPPRSTSSNNLCQPLIFQSCCTEKQAMEQQSKNWALQWVCEIPVGVTTKSTSSLSLGGRQFLTPELEEQRQGNHASGCPHFLGCPWSCWIVSACKSLRISMFLEFECAFPTHAPVHIWLVVSSVLLGNFNSKRS
jgi:hypothetical protein